MLHREYLAGRQHDNPFRNLEETIDALASDPPALKLSRKRTLDVAGGMSFSKHNWQARCDSAHTLSSNGTVVPPLFEKETFKPVERMDEAALTVTSTTFLPRSRCRCTKDLTLAMSSSRVGGGGCVPKYDSAENRDPSESGAVMVEQQHGL